MSDKHQRILAIGRASDGLPVDLDECGFCHEEWPCRAHLVCKVDAQAETLSALSQALGCEQSKIVQRAGEYKEAVAIVLRICRECGPFARLDPAGIAHAVLGAFPSAVYAPENKEKLPGERA